MCTFIVHTWCGIIRLYIPFLVEKERKEAWILSIHNIGGNQRELARARNAKKQAAQGKGKASSDKGGSKGQGLEQRKQRDADIMREKQKKAADAKK